MNKDKKDIDLKYILTFQYKDTVLKLNEILKLINDKKEELASGSKEYKRLLEIEINVTNSLRSLIRNEMDLINMLYYK